jgi:signal transduction histidine kinase
VDPVTLFKTNKRGYFRSSSFVMALLFTVLLGMASGILGYSGYYLNRNHFILSMEEILDTEYSYLKSAEASGQLQTILNERLSNPNRIYLLIHNKKDFVSGNITSSPDKYQHLKDGLIYFTQEDTQNIFAAKSYELTGGLSILIGSNMSDLVYTERVILWMGAATILLMMLVIIASYLISTFVVSRTNNIAETARTIMDTGDLSRRIIIDSRWDDLSNMAYVLNNLLARIEELMTGIRRVADNIAHDLRTPLTRLRNNLEVLSKDVQHNQIDSLINEADHILSTFQAVLRISKIENAPSKEHFKNCDLKQILNDVIELYDPLAIEKLIHIEFDMVPSAAYFGDTNLLFQMYANLLDNALKFTPAGGKIIISLTCNEHQKYITVIRDSGVGITEEDQKYVFDRFYRGEKSRSSEGNGLGLSLVQAVIQLHNGRISLESNRKGLCVTIIL